MQIQRQTQLHGILAKGGLLHVLVHSGRDLPKMDRFGKSDPYCVIEADGQKQKTKVSLSLFLSLSLTLSHSLSLTHSLSLSLFVCVCY